MHARRRGQPPHVRPHTRLGPRRGGPGPQAVLRPHEARRDAYRRMARERGYRSRSAYKLKELNRAYRVIGAGFGVLDVGCCPGGWTQVAVQLSGSRGRVMGIDTSHTEGVPGAHTVRLDVSGDGVAGEVLEYFGRRVDAVVCDLSPQVSGNWSVDHARQVSVVYRDSRVGLLPPQHFHHNRQRACRRRLFARPARGHLATYLAVRNLH
ncbi:MAG: RlmE family RNA methyltransferase [Thaumarchaeota archaeon S15]|nr:MAG: RlmE family RNA methyltransferase [Thaumarchaeota archaeon S15]